MRQSKTGLGLIVIILLLVSGIGIKAQESSLGSISYVRMYADDSGKTHFKDETIKYEDSDVPDFEATPFTKASSISFTRTAATLDTDWHPAPRRQWVLILSGTLEVEVQDGEIRRFPSGSVFFVEDTSGKGHKTRVVGGKEVLAAWIPVDPE